jgi:4-diphosphocytidyl-2-C-methyl-D-erythritol kinase
MAATLEACSNDLEPAAIGFCPEIADVLAALRAAKGCLLARMSGSGATCFGLFADAATAREAAGGVSRPGWWQWSGALAATAPGGTSG